jgi:hypothetical protein
MAYCMFIDHLNIQAQMYNIYMSLSWWDRQFSVDAPIMNDTERPHSRGKFGVIARDGVGKFHPTSVSQKFVTVSSITESKSTF